MTHLQYYKTTSGLGGERSRWEMRVSELALSYTNVIGDILLSAGIVAYLGTFTSTYRDTCVAEWIEQLNLNAIQNSSASFSLTHSLSNGVQGKANRIST